ncbi:MAG: site-specific DNA-methyltransferase, partial [Caldilineaceae bacterium]|nr:site-specific DNA-methyltransferase [Caldilineaceae bacterium]
AVFDEVRRVLRDDGTLWLNLGDSYAANRGYQVVDNKHKDVGNNGSMNVPPGLKPKDLVGIPWRVAFALQASGWWLRSDIIWAKPNPMPESVTDRPTKAHEYLFLLAKAERYYYDAEAIREPMAESSIQRINQENFWNQTGGEKDYRNGTNANRSMRNTLENFATSGISGRNKRSVWTISTRPYPEAHFATFPPALVEPCVMAGTSAHGVCPACGAPWVRVVERTDQPLVSAKGSRFDRGKTGNRDGGDRTQTGERYLSTTTGWQPSCDCHAPALDNGVAVPFADDPDSGYWAPTPIPATVLDPFAGSGTTLAVAVEHKRSAVGIELNPAYVDLIHKRLGRVQPRLINL